VSDVWRANRSEEAELAIVGTEAAVVRKRGLRSWLMIGALVIAAAACSWYLTHVASLQALGLGDYIAYWSAGRVIARGGNPYSPEELLPLQEELGWPDDWPDIMYYPPWTLALVMPFGMLPFWASRLTWLLVHASIVVWCADRLWLYFGGPTCKRWLACALALTSVPTLIALRMGQIGPLLLLGITVFLLAERKNWDWLGGAALLLPAIKPQLTYLFGLAVLLWAIQRGRWRILAGAIGAAAVAWGIALWRDPHVWQHYRFAYVHPPLGNVTPTIGSMLRLAFGEERIWLTFVPTIICLALFPLYWFCRRRTWSWEREISMLLVASFLTTVYGAWVFDIVALLVVVMQAACWVVCFGSTAFQRAALAGYIALDAVGLVMNLRQVAYPYYIWITPAILVGYLAIQSALVPRVVNRVQENLAA
jgi:hypothetical protein